MNDDEGEVCRKWHFIFRMLWNSKGGWVLCRSRSYNFTRKLLDGCCWTLNPKPRPRIPLPVPRAGWLDALQTLIEHDSMTNPASYWVVGCPSNSGLDLPAKPLGSWMPCACANRWVVGCLANSGWTRLNEKLCKLSSSTLPFELWFRLCQMSNSATC